MASARRSPAHSETQVSAAKLVKSRWIGDRRVRKAEAEAPALAPAEEEHVEPNLTNGPASVPSAKCRGPSGRACRAAGDPSAPPSQEERRVGQTQAYLARWFSPRDAALAWRHLELE